MSGKRFEVKVIGAPFAGAAGANGAAPKAGAGTARKPPRGSASSADGGGGLGDALTSPIQGTVLKVAVEPGAAVEEGALIAVIEAMKMENEITAHKALHPDRRDEQRHGRRRHGRSRVEQLASAA